MKTTDYVQFSFGELVLAQRDSYYPIDFELAVFINEETNGMHPRYTVIFFRDKQKETVDRFSIKKITEEFSFEGNSVVLKSEYSLKDSK